MRVSKWTAVAAMAMAFVALCSFSSLAISQTSQPVDRAAALLGVASATATAPTHGGNSIALLKPTISSFSPDHGPVGTSVTINGTNFAATVTNNNVTFNGVNSSPLSGPGTTKIVAPVPTGATTGPISVVTSGGTATTSASFRITPPPPTITSFSPGAGAPGSTITITGTNFSTNPAYDGVYFADPSGGTLDIQATVTAATSTTLTVTVPGAISGKIMVTTYQADGVIGSATSATNFGMTVPVPVVSSFSPTFGPVGTQVTISGSNYDANTPTNNAVFFNGVQAAQPTVDAQGTALTTTVPSGATTGPISVTVSTTVPNIGAATGTSGSSYYVGVPPPTITGFSPASAAKGTLVTISGSHFGATAGTLQLAGTTLTPSNWSDTSITFSVPNWGYTSGVFSIFAAGGQGNSSGSFTITPAVTSFSPASGAVGSSVVITGSGFNTTASSNTVKFNGVAATVASATGTSLTVTVPSGATTGLIAVTVAGVTVNSATNFTVTPGVTSFSPTSGTYGTSVTITGTNFSTTPASNTVKFNGVTASVSSSTATSISTTVPELATTGQVSVTVGGQTGTSATNFTLPAPTITGFSPASAAPGATITINGSNFAPTAGNNTVYFTDSNGTTIDLSASVTSATPTALTVVVPGAYSGKVKVTTSAGVATSATGFTVTVPVPTITSFTPTIGPAGTVVTITGTHFDGGVLANNVVTFNGFAATVNSATSTSIVAIVPSNATTGPIAVTVSSSSLYIGSATATSASNYTVGYPPPTISGFTPTSGVAGTSVTISGTNFGTGAGCSLSLAGIALSVTSWADTAIVASVPAGLSSGQFTVVTLGGQATSAGTFTLLPSISNFSPMSGPIGTSVTINGSGFSSTAGNNTVRINGTTATVTAASATSLTITVPSGATAGAYPIAVTVAGNTAPSAGNFTVTPAVTSFTPTSGIDGTSVTITGNNFSATPANNTVKFNGTTATVTAASTTSLTATVPLASTGPISVTVNGATGTSASNFTVPAATITSFSPTSGAYGSTVTITGTNFSPTLANNAVYFTDTGGSQYIDVAATVTAATPTSLTVTVPAYAASGKIAVNTRGIPVTSAASFTVTVPPPTISSFTPTIGPTGTVVTITGTNFDGATLANNVVTFNGFAATLNSATSTSIVAVVPSNATTGPIAVTVSSGQLYIGSATATSSTNYTVGYPPPTITGFTPTSGPPGTAVTISGTHFYTDPLSIASIELNGAPISIRSWSDTAIVVVIPEGAASGQFTVNTPVRLSVTSAGSFTVTQSPPVITGFSPNKGPVGTTVMIEGAHFSNVDGGNVVKFAGVTSTDVKALSSTRLTAVVPSGAQTGAIEVDVGSLGTTGTGSFAVVTIPPPPPLPPLDSRFYVQVPFNGVGWYGLQNSMPPAASGNIMITFKNTGSTTWTTEQHFQLGAPDATWGKSRVPLTGPVAPGEYATFNFWITSPAKAGVYQFDWMMVQDVPGAPPVWFGETSNAVVQVGDPAKLPQSANQVNAVVGSGNVVAVSWKPPPGGPGPTYFEVGFARVPSGPWAMVYDALPADATTAQVTVSYGQYYFEVAACTSEGCSPFVSSPLVTVDGSGPACATLIATLTTIDFPADGGPGIDDFIKASTDCKWKVNSDGAPWLTVEPKEAAGGKDITLTPNGPNPSSTTPLTGTVLITTDQDPSTTLASIAVTQDRAKLHACDGLTVRPTTLNFPVSGGTVQTVTVDASAVAVPTDCVWTVSNPNTWLKLAPGSNAAGIATGSVSFVPVGPNTSTAALAGTVTIGGSDLYLPVAVTQASNAPATPTAPQLAPAPPTDLVSDSVGATTGTFSVDQQGNATYQIPIYSPHGAGGLTPGFALAYNSAEGEGALGVGWQLQGESAISICRRTQEHGDGLGVSDGAHYGPSAVYCLDGQRLVLMSASNTNGTTNAVYRLENDSFVKVTIETADTTNGNPGFTVPTTWAVHNKDGTVHRYGGSAMDQSAGIPAAQLTWIRAADSAKFTKSWYRYEIKDSNGVAVEFNYAHYPNSSGQNVAVLPTLASATYSGGTITFNNGFCGNNQPINYQGGVPVQRTVALGGAVGMGYCTSAADGTSQTMAGITVANGNGTVVRNYKLTYQFEINNPAVLQLTQLQECDGTSTVCYAPTVFNWANSTAWSNNPSAQPVKAFNGNSQQSFFYALPGSVRFGDINGDGRSDVVFLHDYGGGKHQNFIIATSDPSKGTMNGGGFSSFYDEDSTGGANCSSSSDAGTPTHNYSCPQQFKFLDYQNTYQLFDFNGDGKDDLLMLEPTSDFEDVADGSAAQYRWVVWLSDGTRFATKITALNANTLSSSLNNGLYPNPCSSAPCDMPLVKHSSSTHDHFGAVQIADLDGDGLPDLFVLNDTGASVWLLKPNKTGTTCPTAAGGTTTCPYLFVGPYDVTVDLPQGASPCTMGYKAAHELRVSDFDGDGRADIVLKQTQACSPPNSPVASDEYMQIFTAVGVGGDGAFHFAPGFAFAHVLSGNNGDYDKADLFQVADINGDGLPDVAYTNGGDSNHDQSAIWYYRINNGAGSFTNSQCVVSGCGETPGPYEIQLGDFDGDGRADFIFPNWSSDPACPSKLGVYLWRDGSVANASGFSTSEVCSPFMSPDLGSSTKNLFSNLVDMDGDGYPDQLIIDTTSNGQFNHGGWQITRVGSHHQPRNMITSVRSGLGALTALTYAPLTYSSVYYREYNGYGIPSGYGAPVQDSFVPRYAVEYAESTAPTESSATSLSTIRYRYAGEKIQGFGRGSLGFHKVYSTDVQTGITTVTTYNQPYPFTGTPAETSAYQGDSTIDTICDAPGGGNPDSPACMQYGSMSDGLSTLSLLSDTVDSYTGVWQDTSAGTLPNQILLSSLPLATATPTPIFMERTASQQQKYGLDGTLLSAQKSSFVYYAPYGELTGSTVVDYADAGFNTVVRTSTTAQVFGGDNTSNGNWWINRVSKSTATVTGGNIDGVNSDSIVRISTFDYDASTGQLVGEHLQPDGGNTLEVNMYHFHDGFGNEIEADTCGHTAGCTASSAMSSSVGSMQFSNSTDSTWIQRYSRSSYDSSGVFADEIFAPFSSSTGGAVEMMTLQVRSRDAFGTPTDTIAPTDASGLSFVETTAATNSMGRTYFAASNMGGAAQTVYRWCNNTSLNPYISSVTTGNRVSCPTNAVYRIKTDTSGRSPTTWGYYDVLGRAVLKVQQGFGTTEFIAVATSYDNLGRVSKTTEPYFTYSPEGSTSVGVLSDSNLTADANCLNAAYCTLANYDVLGRATTIKHPNNSITNTVYSSFSTRVTMPANGSGQVETRTKTQNHLGQIQVISDANGSTVTNLYDPSGNVKSVTRPGGIVSTMNYDVLGRKTGLSDPDAGSWTYTYNALGEQVSKTGSGTCTVNMYDGRGRVFSRIDYASKTCTGAADASASWLYDTATNGLGQLKSSSSHDNTGGSSVGAKADEVQAPTYDEFGRVSTVVTTINTISFTQKSTYDQYGRPFQGLFYADGVPLSGELYTYSSTGYPSKTQDGANGNSGTVYSQVTSMDARGHVTAETHANGYLSTTRSYDTAMGWLTKIASAQGSNSIQSLVYQYDALGNLMQRNDTSPGSGTSEYSCYDALQRLVWQGSPGNSALPATCPSNAVTPTPLPAVQSALHAFAAADTSRLSMMPLPMTANAAVALPSGVSVQNNYDPLGNISNNGQFGYIYGTYATQVCTAAGEVSQAGPDAVTQANGITYCYDYDGNQTRSLDASGNMLRLSKYTAYDAMRSVSSSSSLHTTSWAYGIGRERLIRQDDGGMSPSASPVSQTFYVGNAEVVVSNSAIHNVKRYVGGLIVSADIANSAASYSYEYLFTDNLGSTHRITDQNGVLQNVGGTQAFTAFGSRASPSGGVFAALDSGSWITFNDNLTHHGFTGHEMMDEVGLIHMNGRVYDPMLSRFMQADPFVQDAGNLQSLNRYSYVLNNPLATTDPTGYWGHRQQGYLRDVAAIAITVATYGAASAWADLATAEWGAADAAAMTTADYAVTSSIIVAGGATAGYVQAGNLKGAVLGGIEAGLDFGIGQAVPYADTAAQAGNPVGNIAAHAALGGVMSVLRGGKFGHGFVSAGLSAQINPNLPNVGPTLGTIRAAIIGGSISRLTGGKFANGAITSAFEFAFNQEAPHGQRSAGQRLDDIISTVQTENPDADIRVTSRGRSVEEQASLMATKSYAHNWGDQVIRPFINEMDSWRDQHPNATHEEATHAFVGIINNALAQGYVVSNHLGDNARDVSIPRGTQTQQNVIRARFTALGASVINEGSAATGPHWHLDLNGH